nr:MAG TPA: hypothetical protein [Caudoviricetes sp.]
MNMNWFIKIYLIHFHVPFLSIVDIVSLFSLL